MHIPRALKSQWGLWVGGLLWVVGVVALVIFQSKLPSDGTLWLDFYPQPGWVENRVIPETPLQEHDRVLSIAQVPLTAWVNRLLTGRATPDWTSGMTLTYKVVRDTERFSLDITLVDLSLGRLIISRLGLYLLALITLACAFFLLFRFPRRRGSRLFFVFALALLPPLSLQNYVGSLTSPWLFWVQNLLKFTGRALVCSTLLHFSLIYPNTKPSVQAHERWLNGLHGVIPLVAIGLGLLVGDSPVDGLALSWRVSVWLQIVMLFAALLSLLETYIAVRNVTVHGQLRWLGWGVLLGGLPYLVLTALPEVIVGRPFVGVNVTSFLLLPFPLAMTVSIARYRLFDVDALVRRLLLLVGFGLLLIGIYHLAVIGVQGVLRGLNVPMRERIAVFLAAFLVSTLFWNYKAHVSRLVGHLLFRSRGDPDLLLNEMSERLTRLVRIEDMVVLLTQTVPERLGAACGCLLLRSEETDAFVNLGETPFALNETAFIDTWLDEGASPLRMALPPAWMPKAVHDALTTYGVELLLPLMVGEELVAIWGVGAPPLRLPYTSEEVRSLQTLGRHAAVALQNAQLVRRLEEHGKALEAEVQRRTKALEKERNRLNALLQNMVDPLLVTDPEGKIMLVNPAFERLLQRSARHLVGKKLQDLMPLPLLAQTRDEVLASPRQVERIQVEWQDRVLKASVAALGELSAVIYLLRDATQEVEVQRMKSEFISAVSHKLLTPLTSIVGFAKLTQRTFSRVIAPVLPEADEVQRAGRKVSGNLEIMQEEGQRLTLLIKDVLDVSALDAGKIVWEDDLYDFPALLREVVDHLQPIAQKKDLDLQLHIEGTFPLLKADPERIEQLVTNLVANALKFTREGRVIVAARRLEPGTTLQGWETPETGGVAVSVKDTGVGISPDVQARLFQRFQQVADTNGNRPPGTGLGLVICREIVNHYEGKIWVESEPGQGSTFAFVLPLQEEAEDLDVVDSQSVG